MVVLQNSTSYPMEFDASSGGSATTLTRLFGLLANDNVVRLLLAPGKEDLTLPQLSELLARSKSLLCMTLAKLWKFGLVSKKFVDGSLHYHLEKRGVLGLIKMAQSLLGRARTSKG